MINLYSAHITSLSIHRAGNKSKGEPIFLSENTFTLNDEMAPLIKEFFFKPFQDKEHTILQFTHEVDIEFHELYQLAKEIFQDPTSTHEKGKKITKYLYDQSLHQHIKSGEVYIAHIEAAMINNQRVDAIGIFKSEIKQDFLQFEENDNQLTAMLQQGVNLNKLDKGCLIFNIEEESGYKILSVDSNRYDTKYWLESFLGVSDMQDEVFFTKNYLNLCRDFAKEVVLPAEDKQQEVLFMNRAMNHFAKNDNFEETAFMNEVIDNPDLIPEFRHYKAERGPK